MFFSMLKETGSFLHTEDHHDQPSPPVNVLLPAVDPTALRLRLAPGVAGGGEESWGHLSFDISHTVCWRKMENFNQMRTRLEI